MYYWQSNIQRHIRYFSDDLKDRGVRCLVGVVLGVVKRIPRWMNV